jgi:hypothetical protein
VIARRVMVTSFFVIASTAKQSRDRKEELDCFVASLLAMTSLFLRTKDNGKL